jgi:2,4-dienoyl-CoA reductase-like NADH-dependent reductase (Old Yellow Enzyme family)/thioredoxin reductase
VKCLEPIRIGSVNVKNRFSMAPMDVRLHTHDGYVTDRSVAHYKRMAQGGVGLINLELHVVRPDGAGPYFMDPRISDDSYIPGMRRIADAIHSEGAVCQVEIGHFGKFSAAEIPLAVSASVPSLLAPDRALHEATTEEVEEVLEDYARCAWRAMEAGFDGVMIHGAHGFLPQQFTSPHSNRRTDKWGQDRLLFSSELIKRVKEICRPDFLISYRLSGDEYYQKLYPDVKGYTVDDLPEIVPRLVAAGVDSIDISAGALDVPRYYAGPDPHLFPNGGYGGYLPLAAAAKQVSSVPVIVTGMMHDPELIEKALGEGMCDMVGMAKQFLADPDFPKKMAEGRPEDIRRCISCLYCATGGGGLTSIDNHSVECAINPELGWAREGYHAIRPVSKAKKVMVAGGGPGGMETARVLKLRGHDVTLYEKSDRLGGQVWSAGVAPGKGDMRYLTDYLATQLRKLDVDVRLNTPVTRDLVEQEGPDALVVATGADQFRPEIPGIDGPNVVMGLDVLLDQAPTGSRVVLIGGEEVACEVADYISEDADKKVTVTSLLPGFATKGHYAGLLALRNIHSKSVEFIPGVREYLEITREGIVLVDSSGEKRMVEADTVVLAAGARPNNGLANQVRGKGLVRESVFTIGDARSVESLYEAIHEGATVAQHI